MESRTFNLEICEQFKNSLMLLQQSNTITVEIFIQLLDTIIKNLLSCNNDPKLGGITSSKPDLMKELYAALSNFIIQTTRYEASKTQMEEYCSETLKIHSNYSSILIDTCLKHRDELRKKLISINTLINPQLIGVDWKLDYIVKTSEISNINSGPIFRIRLVTKKYNPRSRENEPHYIDFNCDAVELTDLVSKLKDITHQIEKLSYT